MNTNSNSTTSTSHPLRPYYQPRDDSTFIASPTSSKPIPTSSTSSSSSSRPPSAPIRSSNSFSTPPTSNKYVSDDLYDQDYSSASGSTSSISDLTTAALTSLALQYTSTCLAMPFEVGKLLLQIQWVPTDQVWNQHAQVIRSRAVAARRAKLMKQKEERRERRLRRANQVKEGKLGIQELDIEEEDEDEEDSEQEQDEFDQQQRHELAPEAEEWQDEQGRNDRGRGFGAEQDELSDSDEAEAYFRDLSTQSTRPSATSSRSRSKRPTDESGYMIRSNLNDASLGTRPEFFMPVVVRGGVWEMIKAVGRGKEGWLGLFKGTLTTFILDSSFQVIQPIFSGFFSLFSPSSSSNLPLAYTPHPISTLSILLTSHLLTGLLLSPLDLCRTRLIAQSTLSSHKKYTGPINSLQQILRSEGGWRTIYFHPNLLIPTILDYSFRPLFNLASPLIIERLFGLEVNGNPISYAVLELGINSLGLLITLPIETVRRRLQLQRRAPWGMVPDSTKKIETPSNSTSTSSNVNNPTNVAQLGINASKSSNLIKTVDYDSRSLRTCVEIRPEPYAGVVEAIYKILTEETSVSHKGPVEKESTESEEKESAKARRKRNESTDSTSSAFGFMNKSGILAAKTGTSSLGGLNSLYRGLGMALSANLVVFVLTIVGGERAGTQGGWAEI